MALRPSSIAQIGERSACSMTRLSSSGKMSRRSRFRFEILVELGDAREGVGGGAILLDHPVGRALPRVQLHVEQTRRAIGLFA